MENIKKFCSFKNHNEVESISFCSRCQIYMCNKCLNHHENIFEIHPVIKINELKNEIFTGYCQEENHINKLEFFCKNHNQLCCVSCICKIQKKGKGQHKDCDICCIEDIKEEKKSKLKDNIKSLEELSNNLDNIIKELKNIFEKVNESKEKLIGDIQKIFTNIRNELNKREDLLLIEVSKFFDDHCCNEIVIKKGEKLPKRIKISLEKGKSLCNEWDNNNNKLNSIINDCINIENNLKDINIINKEIKKYNENKKINLKFIYDIDTIMTNIENFGYLSIDIDTLILKNENDMNKFFELIKIKEKIYGMNLLYRASRDGLNYLNIVNKINNKSNLIFLYLTGNNRIFGAFIKAKLANINMNGEEQIFKDENAFAFSLNLNKKYKILIPEYAILIDKINFIRIGNSQQGDGLYFKGNSISDSYLIGNKKIYDFSKNSELTEGNGNLIEFEIFELIFK